MGIEESDWKLIWTCLSLEKGQAVPLEEYRGKVVLIVNTASKCGFTPQYKGLEELYKSIKEKHGMFRSRCTQSHHPSPFPFPLHPTIPVFLPSTHTILSLPFPGDEFTILGFPCNQFGSQEPGSDADIQTFCQVNYGVSFPILGKTDVNGSSANPLFEWLKSEKPGLMGLKRVKWNFEKFLVGRDGRVVGRWASTTKPESLEAPILEELGKGKERKAEL